MLRWSPACWAIPVICTILIFIVTYDQVLGSKHWLQVLIPSRTRARPSSPPFNWDDGKYQWFNLEENYPVSSIIPLPLHDFQPIPQIQWSEWHESANQRRLRLQRREAVLHSFTHSWQGYKTHAWLRDEVGPLSGKAYDHFGGWAATLVDSLDTLWIMGLEEEFEEAVAAVRKIDFSTSALEELNVFETTIRFLGGLLSAYDISGGLHQMLYVRAIELGKVIYKAFDTPNRMPIVRFDWHQALGGAEQEASDSSLVAEIGSLTLELTYLAQHTMDENYYDAITRVSNVFHAQQNATRLPGLFPLVVNARDSNFTEGSLFTLGGMVDSLYEYLPKQYLLLGGQSQQYRELYEQALIQMKRHIFFRPMTPEGHDILLAGSVEVGGTSDDPTVTLNPEVQHLTCFVGGMVALGAKAFANPSDLDLARKLVDGCTWAYDIMPMGIMPEIMHAIPCPTLDHCEWDEERWRNEVKARGESTSSIDEIIQQNHLPRGVSKVDDTRYGLRPEAIESVFILYRITGDTKLQDKAWQMFESIIKATRTDIGAAALSDCTRPEVPPTDRMESFWLAETLKYFYLIFSEPELISLDEYVLNTEAHPLKRPDYEK